MVTIRELKIGRYERQRIFLELECVFIQDDDELLIFDEKAATNPNDDVEAGVLRFMARCPN